MINKNRLSNIININILPLYVFKTKPEILTEIKNCIKVNLHSNTYNTSSDEIIKLDLDRIIETINFCSNKKLSKNKLGRLKKIKSNIIDV